MALLVANKSRNQPYDVYIGRPSDWGNPFPLDVGSRREVLVRYTVWLLEQPNLLSRIGELTGKVLGCWCWPHWCHGDVLTYLANHPAIFWPKFEGDYDARYAAADAWLTDVVFHTR